MHHHTISEPAMFARVKRALWRIKRQSLHRCDERSRWLQDLGHIYAADDRNNISGVHIDLKEMAQELGVIRLGEVFDG